MRWRKVSRTKRLVSLFLAMILCVYSVAPVYAQAISPELADVMAAEVEQPDKQEALQGTPQPEQTPAAEQTLIPEQTPAAEQTPAPEQTQAPEQTPLPEETPAPEATLQPQETPAPEQTPLPEETPAPEPTLQPQNSLPADTTAPETPKSSESAVYQDGVILLYTYEQLCAVGSGKPVMTGDADQMGSGEAVTDAEGNAVTYDAAAQYSLARDIELPASTAWSVPENFTGRIAPRDTVAERPLYRQSDPRG